MTITVSSQTIITLAAVISALGVIGAAILWCVRFIQRDARQDQELQSIQAELKIICRGLRACLEGMVEQGVDGPCKKGLEELNRHLNDAAHTEAAP